MNQPIDPAAKAEAARTREEEARKAAQKKTITFALAMFGIVFALLSFKYVTGNDPTMRGDSLAAQREAAPAQSAAPDQQWQDDGGWGDDSWGDDGDDNGGWQQPQQSQPQGQSAPPTTGAS